MPSLFLSKVLLFLVLCFAIATQAQTSIKNEINFTPNITLECKKFFKVRAVSVMIETRK